MTSVAIVNIFAEGQSDNAERGKTKIYANAYLTLKDGTQLLAYDNATESFGWSLYDVLSALDAAYPNLGDTDRALLDGFVAKWADVIASYQLENLLANQ